MCSAQAARSAHRSSHPDKNRESALPDRNVRSYTAPTDVLDGRHAFWLERIFAYSFLRSCSRWEQSRRNQNQMRLAAGTLPSPLGKASPESKERQSITTLRA